jgi:hypothetical protein
MAANLAGCTACEFGQFQLTPTGRPLSKIAGRCKYKVPELALPVCMTINVSSRGIWPDMGKDCPTFKQKGE